MGIFFILAALAYLYLKTLVSRANQSAKNNAWMIQNEHLLNK